MGDASVYSASTAFARAGVLGFRGKGFRVEGLGLRVYLGV
jgi:hypothetical protein